MTCQHTRQIASPCQLNALTGTDIFTESDLYIEGSIGDWRFPLVAELATLILIA